MTRLVKLVIFAVLGPPCWAGTCDHISFTARPRLRECAKVSGTPDLNGNYVFQDHKLIGGIPECLAPIEENSVRCYKWVLGIGCEPSPPTRLFLRERPSKIEDLITEAPDSVTFHSPNFHTKRKKHYYTSALCVYNINLKCGGGDVVVRSTSGEQQLFQDGRDYIHLSFGDGNFTQTAHGESVAGFYERVKADSLTAVFWSDGAPGTNKGRFQFHVQCDKPPGEILEEEEISS